MQSISHFKVVILLITLLLMMGMKRIAMQIEPLADLEYQQAVQQADDIKKQIEEKAKASPATLAKSTAEKKTKKNKKKKHSQASS